MDLLQGISERYLLGKANAAPQQLENYVKKQLKGPVEPAQQLSTPAETAKDQEIARLKKQLQASSNTTRKEERRASLRPTSDSKRTKEFKKEIEGAGKVQRGHLSNNSNHGQDQSSRHGDEKENKDEDKKTRHRGRSISPRTAVGALEERRRYSALPSKGSQSQDGRRKRQENSSRPITEWNDLATQERKSSKETTAGSHTTAHLTSENLSKLNHASFASQSRHDNQPYRTSAANGQTHPRKPLSRVAPEKDIYVVAVEEEEEPFHTRPKAKSKRGKDTVEVISDHGRVLYWYP
ncbi:MAG: hypothetical protein Q9190_003312 [Brigantiaea leucoxantha]